MNIPGRVAAKRLTFCEKAVWVALDFFVSSTDDEDDEDDNVERLLLNADAGRLIVLPIVIYVTLLQFLIKIYYIIVQLFMQIINNHSNNKL